MTGFVDQFLHVDRQVAFKAQPVRCDRMDEAQHRRVKRLALEIQPLENVADFAIGPSIEGITQQGVAEAR